MVRHSNTMASLLAWVGLLVGAVIWAANTQWSQIAPYLDCQTRYPSAGTVSFLGAAIVSVTSLVSWRMTVQERAPHGDPAETWRLIALVSASSGAIFAFALVMQGLAAMVIEACDR